MPARVEQVIIDDVIRRPRSISARPAIDSLRSSTLRRASSDATTCERRETVDVLGQIVIEISINLLSCVTVGFRGYATIYVAVEAEAIMDTPVLVVSVQATILEAIRNNRYIPRFFTAIRRIYQ